MSVSTSSLTVNKPTKEEELFLVNLKREEKLKIVHPEVDDHDHEPRRDRSRSIGEELFSFHLRRSHGLNLDLDELLAEATLAADADLKVASDSENAASEADQHSLHKKNTKELPSGCFPGCLLANFRPRLCARFRRFCMFALPLL
jgi:hypothetical protein